LLVLVLLRLLVLVLVLVLATYLQAHQRSVAVK